VHPSTVSQNTAEVTSSTNREPTGSMNRTVTAVAEMARIEAEIDTLKQRLELLANRALHQEAISTRLHEMSEVQVTSGMRSLRKSLDRPAGEHDRDMEPLEDIDEDDTMSSPAQL